MKFALSILATAFLATSAEASDIKVYDNPAKAEKSLAHGTKRSKKNGVHRLPASPGAPDPAKVNHNKLKSAGVNNPGPQPDTLMSGHRKKKSPKDEKVKF